MNDFNFFMVIINERLPLCRAYLFDSKHIFSISLVVKNFSNISCGRIGSSKKGGVKV